MNQITNNSVLIFRADVLAILLASFLQGGDKPTLFALAVALGVEKDFQNETGRLEDQRTITLDRLPK